MIEQKWTDIDLFDNIVKDIFAVLPTYRNEYNTIILDLDSCLSILSSKPLPETYEDKLLVVRNTVTHIAKFLESWKNTADIHVFYSFKPSKLINEYIPEWNNVRNKRLTTEFTKLVENNIVDKLKNIKLNNIHIHKCEDSTIIDVFKYLKMYESEYYGESVLVISRDLHYQCLFKTFHRIEVYNGKYKLDVRSYRKIEGYPDLNPRLLPYYYTLVGIVRNDFKGTKNIGPMKALQYINLNLQNILAGKDTLFNEERNKKALQAMELNEIIK